MIIAEKNKKKVKYFIFILLVLVIVTVSAIFMLIKNNMDKEPIKIIYIPKVIDDKNDFWSALIAGAEMAAKEYNVDLTVAAPDSEEDYLKQNELIAWAIKEKPDAIAISPASLTKTTKMAKKVVQNNIKLIFIDSYIEEDVEDAIVATDNFEAGKKMGEFAMGFIDKEPKIGIVSYVKTASTAIEREEGFRAALGEGEEWIVDVVFCDASYDKAYDLTLELLERHPDINMIVGLNEYSAVGAARAIKDRKLENTIKVFGFDSSIEEIKLLEEDVFQGIVIQKSFNMGYLGIKKAVKVVKGEKIQENIDSGSQLITKENMHTMENQKLLFPFIR